MVRRKYPAAVLHEEGRWVLIPSYPLPQGWNRSETEVAFQINDGHPGVPPYGFYVPIGLEFEGHRPVNYTDPATEQPPFDGTWGLFSWVPEDGEWQPKAEAEKGSNLLDWVNGFTVRFADGV